MRHRFLSVSALGCTLSSLLVLPLTASAQAPPPPPPPPSFDDPDAFTDDGFGADEGAAPAGETNTQEGDSPAQNPADAGSAQEPSGQASGAVQADAGAAAAATATTTEANPYATESAEGPSGQAPGGAAAAGEETTEADEIAQSEERRKARLQSLRRQSTLTGSTGLMRVREAGSSAAGTFRFSAQMGMNSMGTFLCHSDAVCADPVTGAPRVGDTSARGDMRATLSVTPFPFLEAFAGFRNVATSNSFGTPQVVNIMGDWNLGVKGFLPETPDRIFSVGGELDLFLLNGSGGVGFDAAATGFSIRALGGLDFSKLEKPIPIRLLANLAYAFDNSSAVVSAFETTPPAQGGRGEPIERTERYGLDVSRVDAFEIGLGAEYMNEWVRPFLEWTIDVPVNRQGYICNISGAASRGDSCLGAAAGFETSPSRLTIGARGFPWQSTGLGITMALDIGTGHTSRFIEEATPEAPYTFWLGVSYGVDVTPIPEIRRVEVEAPPEPAQMRRYAFGRVVDEKTGEPVGEAQLRFADGSRTGLIAGEVGTFMTSDLPPGVYDFKVNAHEYEDGNCQLTIPENVPPVVEDPAPIASAEPVGTEADPAADNAAEAPVATEDPTAPYLDVEGNLVVPIRCEIKPLPKVATITGVLVGAPGGEAISDATVVITDKLGRSLRLAVDAQGAFQFRNVPFGSAQLKVTAPGYMPTVRDVTIASREAISANLVLNTIPKKPNVKVTPKELAFGEPIAFISNTPNVAPESMNVIEELAYVLGQHPEISEIEVQVHTDDSGSATEQRRISQDRATRIAQILTQLGVDQSRIKAKGYGPDQPLSPNISEANRAKNNRVQVVVLSKQ